MFTHKMVGYLDHQHETVEQARFCEQGRQAPNTVVIEHGGTRAIVHQTPCVCGPYDRCGDVRVSDAQRSGNWRDRFRSYCD